MLINTTFGQKKKNETIPMDGWMNARMDFNKKNFVYSCSPFALFESDTLSGSFLYGLFCKKKKKKVDFDDGLFLISMP